MTDGPERCPCCNQIVRTAGTPYVPARVCYDCGRGILRHHKWQMATRKGLSVVVHRVCSNPDSYMRTAAAKKAGVVGYKSMTPEQVAAATAKEDELEAGFAAWRAEQGRE